MTKVTNSDERFIAAIGLALDKGKAVGEKPDLVEIDLWRRDQMPTPRASEVRAHILRDPECHRLLKVLDAADRELAVIEAGMPVQEASTASAGTTATRSGILQWIKKLLPGEVAFGWNGALATGIAALFLAVIGLQLIQDPSLREYIDEDYTRWDYENVPKATAWPWSGPVITKGLDIWPDPVARASVASRQAFRSGVRLGLNNLTGKDTQWLEIRKELTEQLPTCPVGAEPGCNDRLVLYQDLGRWSLLLFLQCQKGNLPVAEQESHSARVKLFKKALNDQDPDGPFSDYLNEWDTGADKICIENTALMGLGFRR